MAFLTGNTGAPPPQEEEQAEDAPVWITLASSYLNAAYHNGATKTLTVEFKDGTQWEYNGVTTQEFDEFLSAPSQGAWFHANVRGRRAGAPVDTL